MTVAIGFLLLWVGFILGYLVAALMAANGPDE